MKIRNPQRLTEAGLRSPQSTRVRTGASASSLLPQGPLAITFTKAQIRKALSNLYDTANALRKSLEVESKQLDRAESKSEGFPDDWYDHRSAIDEMAYDLSSVIASIRGLDDELKFILK